MKSFKTLMWIVTLGITAHTTQADITVKGSDTLVILAQKWAEVYMQEHPSTQVQVTGGGSGVGLAALQNQQTDLCNASRKIKAKEIAACIKAFGKRPTEYKVALDGISLYINENNPVQSLSLPQLDQIFTGKTTNWKDVGGPDAPIVLYSRENSSGTYEFFKDHVLQGKDFAASAQTMPGTAAILQAVAKDKNGIGYGGAAYATGVKVVKISKDDSSAALEPSTENVSDMSYPISRYLYIYVNPALDQGDIAAYLNWIRSDAGQAVVKDIGYFPLPNNLRSK
ncbi:MAG: PstS family phosphate ABC transporter substrate-binding protein [Limisphaerales bacterium]